MEDLYGKSVLVLGLGISGRSAANFCAQRGARVVAADTRDAAGLEALDSLDAAIRLQTGEPFPDPAEFDLVIPSPGVPAELYRARARRIWGDVELASRFLSIPIVAITGTNGKSTTTLLVETLLRAAGFRARAAGNIGTAVLDLVGEAIDIAVLEVSSFQLETTESFRPRVAAVLNISPDHLDRHGSLEAYVAAKARIVANQEASDVAVLNMDDVLVRAFANETKARIVPVRCQGPSPGGAWLDTGTAVVSDREGDAVRIPLDGFRLRGDHNRENALFALAIATAAGAEPLRAAAGLATFTGLPHRGEVVRELAGVRWVDDSKATNPGAAARAISSADGPVIWIAGGLGKGLDFGELAGLAQSRVRVALLIGTDAAALEAGVGHAVPTRHCGTLAAAVAVAAEIARPGDCVLLAPACASTDQFRDYRERGERFRQAVERLQPEGERN